MQQLGHMEDTHEELIGVFKWRGIMATLEEVLDNRILYRANPGKGAGPYGNDGSGRGGRRRRSRAGS